ncbi:hypothetical protein ACFQY0_06860 [Haloferula chungangensis]|uniref:Glycosyl hydrolase family 67 n=1 Tax=Haloferula chungangensis TaxID=1048331 RepID=A0ABW2L734_9BACT
MTKLFLIDAIGPFFRGYEKRRINWSKIPFGHLQTVGEQADDQWQMIEEESRHFAGRVSNMGYNAVTLDDLAHLSDHPWFEDEVRERNSQLAARMRRVMDIHLQAGMKVFVTSDVVCTSSAIDERLAGDRGEMEEWYADVIRTFFESFPEVSGLILRIGESDGLDVDDPIRSRLHIRTAKDARKLLGRLLPLFESLGKKLILRTWTVGAHPIGDLIWHRNRIGQMIQGLKTDALILSFKHGASDFFRYLPLNDVLTRTKTPKIIEFQGRREYEGAGEYPSFIGSECEAFHKELEGDENLVGFSMWCMTGGWHGFRRRPFVESSAVPEEIWIELNCVSAIGIFRHKLTARQTIEKHLGSERVESVMKLLQLSDIVIRELLYIPDYAQQQRFFRRVRIPPLVHVYWDCIFFTAPMRKLMRHFVSDHEGAVRDAEAVLTLFEKMKELARSSDLPVEDIEFMQDSFQLIALARRYYFLPWKQETIDEIIAAKKRYKQKWPRSQRQRYRIKTEFKPFKVKRRTIGWVTGLLLRKQSGYRVIDHLVILSLLSFIYRLVGKKGQKALPKFVRKSAMGIDSVMR